MKDSSMLTWKREKLMSDKKYIVFRTDFEHLEQLLNKCAADYPNHSLYQIIPESKYDGAILSVILERHVES